MTINRRFSAFLYPSKLCFSGHAFAVCYLCSFVFGATLGLWKHTAFFVNPLCQSSPPILFTAAFQHILKIILFLFATFFVINLLTAQIGIETLARLFWRDTPYQPFITAFLGLISGYSTIRYFFGNFAVLNTTFADYLNI